MVNSKNTNTSSIKNKKNSKNKYLFIFFLIFLIGIFLRFYQIKARFLYGHDNDLIAWIVKDIVVDGHLRLIGQETSTQGIFIGALYYYLQIPFFWLLNMDPIAEVVASSLIGLFGIFSSYFVFKRIFGETSAIIASLLISVSYFVVSNDREAVPTTPVLIWTIWFFYSLYKIKEDRLNGFILAGILVSLIWHLNVTLILLAPLWIWAFLYSEKKEYFKKIIVFILTFVTTSLPLFVFETRHGFMQTGSFIASLTTKQGDIISGGDKLRRVIFLVAKNVKAWSLTSEVGGSVYIFLLMIAGIYIYLLISKKINKFLGLAVCYWLVVYIVFFASYSKIVSEYYLNGLFFVVLLGLVLFIACLFEKGQKYKISAQVLVAFFCIVNINAFLTKNINHSGYVEKNNLIDFINYDMSSNGFGCAGISYITDPGYELGYRYFFWKKQIVTKHPSFEVPVYSIVFPINKVDRVDYTFGSLGLILPEERWKSGNMKPDCSGGNTNLTDTMFGFVN